MKGRVLAVDPGEKKLGVAISDPTGTIANPLRVIKHVGRAVDAAAIAELVQQNQVVRVVVGQTLMPDGSVGPHGRHSAKLAEAIQALIEAPVELWDEWGSTNQAREARIAMGVKRKSRQGHMDELAATVILQSYLDEHFESEAGSV